MPFQQLNLREAAEYLHLSPTEVEALVKRDEIPFEKRGDRLVFRKRDIEVWASQRVIGLEDRRLDEYHQKTTQGTRDLFESSTIFPLIMQAGYLAPNMTAKTKSSVLRELVRMADETGLVTDSRDLLQSLEERETLCPTAMPGGLAVPHPRHHQHYLFENSFILLGRTIQQIPFGAPDGQPTDLFFLVCCQDERYHLHALARLCLVAQKTSLLAQLRECSDAMSMHQCLLTCEVEALQRKRPA